MLSFSYFVKRLPLLPPTCGGWNQQTGSQLIPAWPQFHSQRTADHRNGGMSWLGEQYQHAHPGKEDIKCTLQADHRNGGMSRLGEQSSMTLPKSVQHYTKRWSYWVVILNLLKIKYLDKSFIIIMWHTLSEPMALQTGHILMSMCTLYLTVELIYI